jgi:hypothetical protein
MTKVGEGNQLPKEPTVGDYRKDLEKNTSKFLKALDQYEITKDSDQKAHFKAVMDESLKLIRNAVKEIGTDGMRRQEGNVEKDYKTYLNDENINHLAALKEDLSYLRQNNKEK